MTWIKAKELIWMKNNAGDFVADAGCGFSYRVISLAEWFEVGSTDFVPCYQFDDGVQIRFITHTDGIKRRTQDDVKQVCQAHYQQMVESMVDMGHKNCTWVRSFDGHFNISCVNETGERANGSFKKCGRYPETKWDFKYCPYCGGEIEIQTLEQEREG